MAEGVDTSSYLKPAALPVQKSLLDQVGQYQTLESNKIGIDQQKLKLMNDHFELMNNDLSAFANDPQATKEEVLKRMHQRADAFNMPSNVRKMMDAQFAGIPNNIPLIKNPALARTLDLVIKRGQDANSKINSAYGAPGTIDTGQAQIPVRTPLRGGPVQSGLPIQKQIPPTTPVIDPETNQPRLQGPTEAVAAPGNVVVPTPIQTVPIKRPTALPVGPIAPEGVVGPSSNFGGTVTGANVEATTPNQVVQNRHPLPSGPVTGMTPLFEEGKKQFANDQVNATQRMMRAKPAIQALPLMQAKGFLAGPGSEQFTHAVAALKTFGLVDTADESDPTAIRQEVSKKLAQYVSGNPVGQRSDAAQILAEASSPNPKAQVLPALIKLTKDAVILDRVEAARSNAFKDKDFAKYPSHSAKFPQSIDERAFGLDLEPEEKSTAMVDSMAKKLNSKNKIEAAQADKFFKSLRIAKDQGFYQ